MILVGEMRDLETIEAAITAAETGHIVFGTLHTTGAQGTVNRIIDVFPTNQQEQIRTQLSTSIIGVLSQALLPKIGGGRVAAYEMLVVTPGHRQPDPREQDLPHHLGDPDRRQAWACSCWTTHMFKLWQDRASSRRATCSVKANSPDELAAQDRPGRARPVRRRGRSAQATKAKRQRTSGMNGSDEPAYDLRGRATMAIRRIGQILVDLGFITDDQLETLLEEQQQRPGELLGQDRR